MSGSRGTGPDVLMRPARDPAGWTAGEMAATQDWLHPLTDRERAEVHDAVEAVMARDLDFLAIDREAFPLPELGPKLAEIRAELLWGRGIVLFRGLDVDVADRRRAAVAFWGIAMHLGDEVLSQNAKGHVLGHVRDIGQTRRNVLQRGPYSREAMPYHTDCCDLAGLYCLHPAKRGGESTVISSVAVYNELLERRPDLVEALSRPIYRDRRGEVPPGMDEWYAIPVFNVHEGWFSATIEPTYIGSAERFPEVPRKSDLQREAIAEVQRICEARHFSMGFRPGDIQFINSHVTFHTRSAYDDHPEPERKRHLFRIWLKCFDGRPLPHWFHDRHGPRGAVDRPGGIVGAQTVPSAPLEAA